MASVTLHPDPAQLPIGTAVKVYLLPANAPAGYAPSGAALSEPTVEAGSGGGSSTLTVTGLTAGSAYVGVVSSVVKIRFYVEEPTSAATVSSVNGKEGAVTLEASDVGAVGLASPAFTGNPTAPTQAAKNSSTRLATTAFTHTEALEQREAAESGAATAAAAKDATLKTEAEAKDAAAKAAAEAASRPVTTAILANTRETWAVGTPEVATLDGRPVVVPAAGETQKAVRADYEILEGTKVTFKLQKNGSDMTGFTGLEAKKEAKHTTPTAVALAEGDIITVVVTAIEGSPKHLSITLTTSHSV